MKKPLLTILMLAWIQSVIKCDEIKYSIELTNDLLALNGSYKIQLIIPAAQNKIYRFDVENGRIANLKGENVSSKDNKIIINAKTMCAKRRAKKAAGIIGTGAGAAAATAGAIAGVALVSPGSLPSLGSAAPVVAGAGAAAAPAAAGAAGASSAAPVGAVGAGAIATAAGGILIEEVAKPVIEKVRSEILDTAATGAKEAITGEQAEKELQPTQETGAKLISSGAGIQTIFGFRNATVQITATDGPYIGQQVKLNYDECENNKWVLDSSEKAVIVTKD